MTTPATAETWVVVVAAVEPSPEQFVIDVPPHGSDPTIGFRRNTSDKVRAVAVASDPYRNCLTSRRLLTLLSVAIC